MLAICKLTDNGNSTWTRLLNMCAYIYTININKMNSPNHVI